MNVEYTQPACCCSMPSFSIVSLTSVRNVRAASGDVDDPPPAHAMPTPRATAAQAFHIHDRSKRSCTETSRADYDGKTTPGVLFRCHTASRIEPVKIRPNANPIHKP